MGRCLALCKRMSTQRENKPKHAAVKRKENIRRGFATWIQRFLSPSHLALNYRKNIKVTLMTHNAAGKRPWRPVLDRLHPQLSLASHFLPPFILKLLWSSQLQVLKDRTVS